MKPFILAAALGLGALGAGSALASPRCNVPMANWQPREALQKKVEAEGWKVSVRPITPPIVSLRVRRSLIDWKIKERTWTWRRRLPARSSGGLLA
jgi:peptidase YpeB-like protein